MNPESKKALDRILQKHESTTLSVEHAKGGPASKEEQFLARFYSVRASILRPAMQEVGEYVRTRGYEYEIDEQNEWTTGDTSSSGTIAIHFITSRQPGRSRRDYPTFSFSCVTSHEGEVPLEELTPDFVERQLVTLARHVFD
jgi:hypothetical protein